MTARDVTRRRQNGLNDIDVEDKDGNAVHAKLICGIQSDGTVTPFLLNASGEIMIAEIIANIDPTGLATASKQDTAKGVLDNIEAGLDELMALFGEKQESPTANTLLERTKAFKTSIDALITIVGEVQASPTSNTILARLKDISTILGEVQASPTSNTILARLKDISTILGEVQASPTSNTLLDRLKSAVTALEIIDNAIGTVTSDPPSGVQVAGVVCETTIPAEGTDGKVGRQWFDNFFRAVNPSYDPSSGSDRVTVGNWPMTPIVDTKTALTAKDQYTSDTNVEYYKDVDVLFVISGLDEVDDTLDYKLQGSVDGTNYETINDRAGNGQVQKSANGSYLHHYRLTNEGANGGYYRWIRVYFADEANGTSGVITATIYARR